MSEARGAHQKLSFSRLPISQHLLAKKFYRTAKYPHKTNRCEHIYVVKGEVAQTKEILACVRIEAQPDYNFLRSMVVHPNHRRQGIGYFLLAQLVPYIKNNDTWCFPFMGLEQLYRHADFQLVNSHSCPATIAERFQNYRSRGRNICIMRRRADSE